MFIRQFRGDIREIITEYLVHIYPDQFKMSKLRTYREGGIHRVLVSACPEKLSWEHITAVGRLWFQDMSDIMKGREK